MFQSFYLALFIVIFNNLVCYGANNELDDLVRLVRRELNVDEGGSSTADWKHSDSKYDAEKAESYFKDFFDYKVFSSEEEKYSYRDAETDCNSVSMTLTSIGSEVENKLIQKLIRAEPNHDEDAYYWIGLYFEKGKPLKWADRSDSEFAKWEKHNEYYGRGKIKLKTGLWMPGGYYDKLKGFVCKRRKNQKLQILESEELLQEVFEYKAVLNSDKKYTFNDAQKICDDAKMNVASITRNVEMNFIQKVMKSQSNNKENDTYWIAYMFNENDHFGGWIDGSDLLYKNWKDESWRRAYNGNCVRSQLQTGQWERTKCDNLQNGFICKKLKTNTYKHGVYLVKEKVDYEEAFLGCLFAGGVLVDVHQINDIQKDIYKHIGNIEDSFWVRDSSIKNCVLMNERKTNFPRCSEKHFYVCKGVAGNLKKYEYKFQFDRVEKTYLERGPCELAVIKNLETLAYVYFSVPPILQHQIFTISAESLQYFQRWPSHEDKETKELQLKDTYYHDGYSSTGRICQTLVKEFDEMCKNKGCPDDNCLHTGTEIACLCKKQGRYNSTLSKCVADYCGIAGCTHKCNKGYCGCSVGYELHEKNCYTKKCIQLQCEVGCHDNKCYCNAGYMLNNDGRTCTKYYPGDLITSHGLLRFVNVKKDINEAKTFCESIKAQLLSLEHLYDPYGQLFSLLEIKNSTYIVLLPEGNCGLLKSGGKLDRTNCFGKHFFICKYPKDKLPEHFKKGINIVHKQYSFSWGSDKCKEQLAEVYNVADRSSWIKELSPHMSPYHSYFVRNGSQCVKLINSNPPTLTSCSDKFPIICEFNHDSFSPYIYRYTEEKKNYKESSNRCDLAVVKDYKTLTHIYHSRPPHLRYGSFFVGIQYVNGKWYENDGTEVVPANGFSLEKVRGDCCIFSSSSSSVYSVSCATSRGRICQFLTDKLRKECDKKGCPDNKCKYSQGKLECSCPKRFIYSNKENNCIVKKPCEETNAKKCSHYCSMENGKPICHCPQKMILFQDGFHCINLLDLCKRVQHNCSQLCINVGSEKYRCACREGYQLMYDKKTCQEIFKTKKFVYDYQYSDKPYYTYEYAESYCKDKQMFLLSIGSIEESKEIQNKRLIYYYGDNFNLWIGLKYLSGKFHWTDNSSVSYTNWKKGKPSIGKSENCVALHKPTMEWFNVACTEKMNGFICKSQVFSNCYECDHSCERHGNDYKCLCRSGYVLKDDYKTCQELFNPDIFVYSYDNNVQSLDYIAGEKKCSSNGGNLVRITSSAEQKHILKWLESINQGGGNLLIGLSDSRIKNSFEWADGSKPTYVNWDKNQPNNLGANGCVFMDGRTGLWSKTKCEESRYICKKQNFCYNFCQNGGKCIIGKKEAFCNCRKGFVGSKCEKDVDECKQFPFICDFKCTNTKGSYKCECGDGYSQGPYGKKCYVQDYTCPFIPHGCQHMCIDTGDYQYKCGCRKGYRLAEDGKSCVDINECEEKNSCGDDGCINLIGTYQCACNVNMTISDDGPKCQEFSRKDAIYYISYEKKSYVDARKSCERRSGYLSGISGLNEMKVLSRRLHPNKTYWIGLCKESNEWKWNKGRFNYSNWKNGRPLSDNVKRCVLLKNDTVNDDFKWYDRPDTETHHFICKLPKSLEWVPNHFSYYISNKIETWQDASDVCQKRNAHLLNVQSKEEQIFLEKKLSHNNALYWTGLKRNAYGLSWSNGMSLYGYSNIYNKSVYEKADEVCGSISKNTNFKWNLTNCQDKYQYICKRSYFNYGGIRFYISHKKMQFEESKKFCRGYQGDLASFRGISDESFLDATLLKDARYWIGATHDGYGDWKWMDGSYVRFDGWFKRKTKQRCATKQYSKLSFKWVPTDCKEFAYAICKVKSFTSKYKYTIEDNLMSWDEGHHFCRRKLGDLFSISNEDNYKSFKSIIHPATSYWIGYHSDNGSSWSDSSPIKYWNFDINRNGRCAYLQRDHSNLKFDKCFFKKPVICKAKEFPFDNYNYWLSDVSSDWFDARRTCWKKGGELISISNKKEEEIILSDVINSEDEIWIGMYKYAKQFVWIDRSLLLYSKLDEVSYQFEERCVYMKRNQNNEYSWKIGTCYKKRNFVCKTPKFQTNHYKYYLITRRVEHSEAEAICSTVDGKLLERSVHYSSCFRNLDPYYNGYKTSRYGACETDAKYACGISKFSPYNSTYLVKGNVKRSWKKAVSYCMEQNGNLLTISSKEEEEHIGKLLRKGEAYWIGLKFLSTKERYSSDEPVEYLPTFLQVYYSWKKDDVVQCVFIKKSDQGDIEWVTASCSSENSFICESLGYYDKSMYKYKLNSGNNFEESRRKCLDDGFDLASITSSDENTHVKSICNSNNAAKNRHCYIGLTNYISSKRIYTWFDNEKSLYRNWEQNEPNYDKIYGVTMSNGLWYTSQPNSIHYSVCKRRVKGTWVFAEGGSTSSKFCQRNPCRNLGKCRAESRDCACKTDFNGIFCQDGVQPLKNLRNLFQDAFEDILEDKYYLTKRKVQNVMYMSGNECDNYKEELYCQIEQAKTMLYDRLLKFNSDYIAEPKAVIISWLLAHKVNVEDKKKLNNVMKSVLGLIYKYAADNDDKSLSRLADLQPKKYVGIVIPNEQSVTSLSDISVVIRNTFATLSNFLSSIKRINSNTKVIVSRYDLREKLKLVKLDSISAQTEVSALEIRRELRLFAEELKDFIYANNGARFSALSDYFSNVAKFDNKKNFADVGYLAGRLKHFDKELSGNLALVTSDLRDTTIQAISAVALEMAETVALMVAELAASMHPFKWASVGNKILEYKSKIAQLAAKMARASYIADNLDRLFSLMLEVSRGFQENAKNIKSMQYIMEHLQLFFGKENENAKNVDDKQLDFYVNGFLKQYEDYGPKVSKEKLAEVGTTLEAYYDEACNLIFENEGTLAAVVEGVAGGMGYCLDRKNRVPVVITLQEEIHDYQYELIEGLAVVCRSFIAIKQASKLKRDFEKGRERPKTPQQVIEFEQKALTLVLTSRLSFIQNIYLYCDYREYVDGGVRPPECSMALNKLTDNSINNLISLRHTYCRNVRTVVALIPTTASEDSKTSTHVPLDKLYAGKEISFQIKSVDWLIAYNWISPFDAHKKAYYLKEFNLILPDTHSSIRTIIVTLSWSDSSFLHPWNTNTRYLLDAGSYTFEYQQNVICDDAKKISNPYDTCNDKKTRLCRVSTPTNLPIYPSLFTEFKLKVRFIDSHESTDTSRFSTDFFLKAVVSICQVENEKVQDVKQQMPLRMYHEEPRCCQQDSCSSATSNRYWKFDASNATCRECPKGSTVSPNGYFCFKDTSNS